MFCTFTLDRGLCFWSGLPVLKFTAVFTWAYFLIPFDFAAHQSLIAPSLPPWPSGFWAFRKIFAGFGCMMVTWAEVTSPNQGSLAFQTHATAGAQNPIISYIQTSSKHCAGLSTCNWSSGPRESSGFRLSESWWFRLHAKQKLLRKAAKALFFFTHLWLLLPQLPSDEDSGFSPQWLWWRIFLCI